MPSGLMSCTCREHHRVRRFNLHQLAQASRMSAPSMHFVYRFSSFVMVQKIAATAVTKRPAPRGLSSRPRLAFQSAQTSLQTATWISTSTLTMGGSASAMPSRTATSMGDSCSHRTRRSEATVSCFQLLASDHLTSVILCCCPMPQHRLLQARCSNCLLCATQRFKGFFLTEACSARGLHTALALVLPQL